MQWQQLKRNDFQRKLNWKQHKLSESPRGKFERLPVPTSRSISRIMQHFTLLLLSKQSYLAKASQHFTGAACDMYLCCWSFSGCGRGFSICCHLVMRCYRDKSYWNVNIKIFSRIFDISRYLCRKSFRHKNGIHTISWQLKDHPQSIV